MAESLHQTIAQYDVRGLKEASRDLTSLIRDLDKAERGLESLGRTADRTDVGIAGLGGTLDTKTSPALANLDRNVQNAGRSLSNLALGIAAAGAAATVAFGVRSVNTAKDFQFQLAQIKGEAGLTGNQLDAVREKSLEMGRVTLFSAAQSADGIREFLKAGTSLDDTFTALRPTLEQAIATNIEMGTVVASTTDIMKQYQFEASEAGRVSDLIVYGQQRASTSARELMEAMTRSASSARLANISIEELTVILDMMANAGTKGERAGTLLSTALARVGRIATGDLTKDAVNALGSLGDETLDVVKKMSEGKAGVLDLFNAIGDNAPKNPADNLIFLGQLTQIFGERSGREIAKILPGFGTAMTTEFKKRMAEIEKNAQGTANRVSAEMQDTVKGWLEQLNASVETIFIRIGDKALPKLQQEIQHTLYPVANEVERIFAESISLEDGITRSLDFLTSDPRVQSLAEEVGEIVGKAMVFGIETALKTMPDSIKSLIGAAFGARFGGLPGAALGAFIGPNVDDLGLGSLANLVGPILLFQALKRGGYKSFAGLTGAGAGAGALGITAGGGQLAFDFMKSGGGLNLGRFGPIIKGVGKVAAPLALLGVAADLASGNPFFTSVLGGVGSVAGGIGGGIAGGAFAAATGGTGAVAIPTAAVAGSVGGGVIGSWLGDQVDTLLGLKQSAQNITLTPEAIAAVQAFPIQEILKEQLRDQLETEKLTAHLTQQSLDVLRDLASQIREGEINTGFLERNKLDRAVVADVVSRLPEFTQALETRKILASEFTGASSDLLDILTGEINSGEISQAVLDALGVSPDQFSERFASAIRRTEGFFDPGPRALGLDEIPLQQIIKDTIRRNRVLPNIAGASSVSDEVIGIAAQQLRDQGHITPSVFEKLGVTQDALLSAIEEARVELAQIRENTKSAAADLEALAAMDTSDVAPVGIMQHQIENLLRIMELQPIEEAKQRMAVDNVAGPSIPLSMVREFGLLDPSLTEGLDPDTNLAATNLEEFFGNLVARESAKNKGVDIATLDFSGINVTAQMSPEEIVALLHDELPNDPQFKSELKLLIEKTLNEKALKQQAKFRR